MDDNRWGRFVRHLFDTNALGYSVLMGLTSGLVFTALGFAWSASERGGGRIFSDVFFTVGMGAFYYYRGKRHQKGLTGGQY